MLGKNNLEGAPLIGGGGLGITDNMINSIMNSLVKSLGKQYAKKCNFRLGSN